MSTGWILLRRHVRLGEVTVITRFQLLSVLIFFKLLVILLFEVVVAVVTDIIRPTLFTVDESWIWGCHFVPTTLTFNRLLPFFSELVLFNRRRVALCVRSVVFIRSFVLVIVVLTCLEALDFLLVCRALPYSILSWFAAMLIIDILMFVLSDFPGIPIICISEVVLLHYLPIWSIPQLTSSDIFSIAFSEVPWLYLWVHILVRILVGKISLLVSVVSWRLVRLFVVLPAALVKRMTIWLRVLLVIILIISSFVIWFHCLINIISKNIEFSI